MNIYSISLSVYDPAVELCPFWLSLGCAAVECIGVCLLSCLGIPPWRSRLCVADLLNIKLKGVVLSFRFKVYFLCLLSTFLPDVRLQKSVSARE